MNEYVQSKVNAPGLALAVFGAASILVNLLIGVLHLVNAIQVLAVGFSTEALFSYFTTQGWNLPVTFGGFFAAFVILLAGLRLRQARSPGLVYAGAIFAMLPCCVGPYCCCFGLPIGLWAIFTMQDDQVKAAFAEA